MNELVRLSISKSIVNLLPKVFRTRIAKFLYNYNSDNIKGIDIIHDYLPDLGLKILINTKEFSGWNIFFNGAYENQTNMFLRKYIKPDDIVIEAGAHYGTESIIIGKLLQKGKGKLYAFEPAPQVRKKLKINIELNSLDNIVELLPYALGEENTELEFYILPEDVPNQGMSSKYRFKESTGSVRIKQIKLDDWFNKNEIQKIDFIKMDVQGSEIDVLKGAEGVINKFKPAIMLEADKNSLFNTSYTIEDLWFLLNSKGYIIKSVSRDEKIINNINSLYSDNWLAIPE